MNLHEACDCPYCTLKEYEKREWFVTAHNDDYDGTYRILVGKLTPEQEEMYDKLICNPIEAAHDPIIKERFETLFNK